MDEAIRKVTAAQAVDAICTLPPSRAGLLRAMLVGNLELWCVPHGAPAPAGPFVPRASLPQVVAIPDCFEEGQGPEAFPAARAAFRWASHVVVDVSGPPGPRESAMRWPVPGVGRVVLVEAPAVRLAEWLAAIAEARHDLHLRGDVHWARRMSSVAATVHDLGVRHAAVAAFRAASGAA